MARTSDKRIIDPLAGTGESDASAGAPPKADAAIEDEEAPIDAFEEEGAGIAPKE